MFEALHTRISLDQFMDLVEINDVSRSWVDATHANVEADRESPWPKK